MLRGLTSVALAFGLGLAACSPPQPTATEQPAEPTATSAPIRGRGVVTAVTPEYNALTIHHEPIPEYDMPAMTMEFGLEQAATLEGIEVGDRVEFVLSGPISISSIEETQTE
jgi:Cu/Ag efflux protein CusF